MEELNQRHKKFEAQDRVTKEQGHLKLKNLEMRILRQVAN